jgi:prolyl 4-hydroxylase
MNDAGTLRTQAAGGDPRAQVLLARSLLKGFDAPVFEVVRLLREACAQNNADALLLHGALATIGLGRAQSFDDAFAYVTQAAALGDTRARGQLGALGKTFDTAWIAAAASVQQSNAPRIFTVEKFLPLAVCDWLKRSAKKRLRPSKTYDEGTGKTIMNPLRTSSVFEVAMMEPDIVQQLVNLRIAQAVDIPRDHQEGSNILRYSRAQQYRAHYDVILPGSDAEMFARELIAIGQRVVTVLIYLNDGYDGGETHFPHLGFTFKGKPGDALIFWNLSAAGEIERNALHAGMPVGRGEKWLLSKWVRQKVVPLI